jgi:hypothetical protein
MIKIDDGYFVRAFQVPLEPLMKKDLQKEFYQTHEEELGFYKTFYNAFLKANEWRLDYINPYTQEKDFILSWEYLVYISQWENNECVQSKCIQEWIDDIKNDKIEMNIEEKII